MDLSACTKVCECARALLAFLVCLAKHLAAFWEITRDFGAGGCRDSARARHHNSAKSACTRVAIALKLRLRHTWECRPCQINHGSRSAEMSAPIEITLSILQDAQRGDVCAHQLPRAADIRFVYSIFMEIKLDFLVQNAPSRSACFCSPCVCEMKSKRWQTRALLATLQSFTCVCLFSNFQLYDMTNMVKLLIWN